MALLVVAIAPLSGVLMAMVLNAARSTLLPSKGCYRISTRRWRKAYGGHQVITAFGHTKKSLEMFDQTNENCTKALGKANLCQA